MKRSVNLLNPNEIFLKIRNLGVNCIDKNPGGILRLNLCADFFPGENSFPYL